MLHDVLVTTREGRYLQLNYSEQFVDDYDGLPQRPVAAPPAHERRAYMLTASRRVATEASQALQVCSLFALFLILLTRRRH